MIFVLDNGSGCPRRFEETQGSSDRHSFRPRGAPVPCALSDSCSLAPEPRNGHFGTYIYVTLTLVGQLYLALGSDANFRQIRISVLDESPLSHHASFLNPAASRRRSEAASSVVSH